MGRRMREGREVMAAMVEVSGEEPVVDLIASRILEGADSRQIAADFGIVPSVLWEWMRANPTVRMKAYREAQKARADMLAVDALAAADEATPDNVQVKKLQADTRLKVAGKWDRETYGDGPQQGGQSGGITVIVDRNSALTVEAADGSCLTVTP